MATIVDRVEGSLGPSDHYLPVPESTSRPIFGPLSAADFGLVLALRKSNPQLSNVPDHVLLWESRCSNGPTISGSTELSHGV